MPTSILKYEKASYIRMQRPETYLDNNGGVKAIEYWISFRLLSKSSMFLRYLHCKGSTKVSNWQRPVTQTIGCPRYERQ